MKFDITVEETVTTITKDLEKSFRLVATHNSADNVASYRIYPIVPGKHKELFVLNKCILMRYSHDISLINYITAITELINNSKIIGGVLSWNGIDNAAYSNGASFSFHFGSNYTNSAYSGNIGFDGIKNHDHIILCDNEVTNTVEDVIARLIVED